MLYVGTSNIVLPVKSKAFFPDNFRDKSRLSYYSSIFNSLEINSTFYKLPMGKTVARWAEEVPDTFRFSFKMPKLVTHSKELIFNETDITSFFQVVNAIGDKKGCILIQFPASIKISLYHRLRQLLDVIWFSGLSAGWQLAIEFRDASWYNDRVYQLLTHYNAIVVAHDMPRSATPDIDMDRKAIYLRYHGEAGDYRGSYSEDFLNDHAMLIRDSIDKGLTVYAYFNNTIGNAVHNAISLNQYLTV